MAGGHAWQGACVAEGHAWQGGMQGRGHAGQRVCGRGCAWQGSCVAGAKHAREMATEAGSTHPTGMHLCLLF